MNKQELIKLRNLITTFINNTDFEGNHKISGYLDNLSVVELIMKIETTFNICICDDLAMSILEDNATFDILYSIVDATKLSQIQILKTK